MLDPELLQSAGHPRGRCRLLLPTHAQLPGVVAAKDVQLAVSWEEQDRQT
jgi:hypothetical protein